MDKKEKEALYKQYKKLIIPDANNPADIKTILIVYREQKEAMSEVRDNLLSIIDGSYFKG